MTRCWSVIESSVTRSSEKTGTMGCTGSDLLPKTVSGLAQDTIVMCLLGSNLVKGWTDFTAFIIFSETFLISFEIV